MKDWSTLKNAIDNVIKTNGNQEITGAALNSVFDSVISALGQNRTFAGVAVPSTNPGAPDGPVFYLAFTKGTYANFAGAKVENNAIILQNTNTTWQAVDTGLKIGSTQDTSYIESCISSLLTDATKVPIVQLQGIILPEDEANDYFNVQDLVGIVYHASRNLITNFANGEFIDNIDQSGYYQGSGAIGMPLSNTIYFVPQITGYAHPGLYWYNGTQLSNITQNLIDHVDGLIEDVNMLQSSVDDLSKPPHNITLTSSDDGKPITWSGVNLDNIHQGDILTWSDTDETYKAVVISENTVDDLRVIQARFTLSGDEGSSMNVLYLYSNGSVTITVFDSSELIYSTIANAPNNNGFIEKICQNLGTTTTGASNLVNNTHLGSALASNTGFVNKLATSSGFVNALATSSGFINALATSDAFLNSFRTGYKIPSALLANSNFTTGLAYNSTFATAFVKCNYFISALANSTMFATAFASSTMFATAFAHNGTFVAWLVANSDFITQLLGNQDFIDGINAIISTNNQ